MQNISCSCKSRRERERERVEEERDIHQKIDLVCVDCRRKFRVAFQEEKTIYLVNIVCFNVFVVVVVVQFCSRWRERETNGLASNE